MFCYFSFGGWKAGISKPKQTPNTLRTFPVHKYLGCSRESVVAVGADVCSPCQHLHCLAGIIGGLASEYCFVALIKSFYDCCKIFFFFFFGICTLYHLSPLVSFTRIFVSLKQSFSSTQFLVHCSWYFFDLVTA